MRNAHVKRNILLSMANIQLPYHKRLYDLTADRNIEQELGKEKQERNKKSNGIRIVAMNLAIRYIQLTF